MDTCAVTGHCDDPLASCFKWQAPDSNDWANFTLPSSSSWVDEGSFWLGLPLVVLMSFDDGGWRDCFHIDHLFVSEDDWGTRPGTRFRSRKAMLRYFKKWKNGTFFTIKLLGCSVGQRPRPCTKRSSPARGHLGNDGYQRRRHCGAGIVHFGPEWGHGRICLRSRS